MPKLTDDVFSFFNPKTCYGKKGEEVTIISVSNKVAIVEGERGNRFPCSIKMLVEKLVVDQVTVKPKVVTPTVPIAAQPPKAKSAPIIKTKKHFFKMAKARKGSKENPITLSELEDLGKAISEANEKPYVITQAAIKDGVCNYTFEIIKGMGSGDSHSVKGSGIVLDDMRNAFNAFNVHLACIDDAFKIAGIEIDDINEFIQHDLTYMYFVDGFKIKGSKDDESIILIGTKHVSTGGHIELQSPKIPLDGFSSYKWYNELKAVADNARMEVELYKEGKYEIAEEEEEKPQKFKQMTILEAGKDEDIDDVDTSGESGNSGKNAAAFFVHDDISEELNQGKL